MQDVPRPGPDAEHPVVTPAVGVDAAVVDPDGRILLVDRADGTGWSLPGGWLEPGEAPEQAAEREAREETGAVVRATRVLDVRVRAPRPPSLPNGSIHITYLATHTGGTIGPSAEATRAAFRRPSEVERWHEDHEDRAVVALTKAHRPVA